MSLKWTASTLFLIITTSLFLPYWDTTFTNESFKLEHISL